MLRLIVLGTAVVASTVAGSMVAGTEGATDPVQASGEAVPSGQARGFQAARLWWADFDGDGLQDAYALSLSGEGRLLRNQGDGNFEDVTLLAGVDVVHLPTLAAWHDFDRDGRADLYVGTRAGPSFLMRNAGDGTFQDVTAHAGLDHVGHDLDAQWLDYDRDGWSDLWVRTTAGGFVYHAVANERFEAVDLGLPVGLPAVAGGPVVAESESGTSAVGDTTRSGSGREQPASSGRPVGTLPSSEDAAAPPAPAPQPDGGFGPFGFALPICADTLLDQTTLTCIEADTTPTLGRLYPMSVRLNVSPAGNVGIGTSSPYSLLTVKGNGGTTSFEGSDHVYMSFFPQGFASGRKGWLGYGGPATPVFAVVNESGGDVEISAVSGDVALQPWTGGNVGIGTTTPTDKLEVAGTTKTWCLTITGGCDLAEPFETVEQHVEPGMVVCVDPERDGELTLARRAYDTTVVGVVSGAGGVKTGMTMSQSGLLDEGAPVALAGRVYCWCDASYDAIRPGDMLTSSDTPGHAMKAGDPSKAFGTVIGKAMSPLSEGQGLVLIVVSLQ